MDTDVKGGAWAADDDLREPPRRSRLVRVSEWALPIALRLGAGYFAAGVERALCRLVHDAARRQTLYRFAPPPPFRLAGHGALDGDEYHFRSPFVSHVRARNNAAVCHHVARPDAARRGDGTLGRRPLVVLNLTMAPFLRHVLARAFLPPLLAAGVDVVVPIAPGSGQRCGPDDRRRGWAHSVGAALSAIVQLVHENVAIEAWARARGYRTVVASGVDVGGAVAALLAATTSCFEAYVPICAGAHPGRVWMPPRPLARAVHIRALARAGLRSRGTLMRLFDPVAPIRLPAPRARQRCTVVGFRFDTVVRPGDVRELAAHWQVEPRWLPRARTELPRCAPELATLLAQVALTGSA